MLQAIRHHVLETRAGGTVRSCFVSEDGVQIGWARLSSCDHLFRFTSYDPRYRDFEVSSVFNFDDPVEMIFDHGRIA